MIKSLKHRKGNIMKKNFYLTSDMKIWNKNDGIGAITYLIVNDVNEFFDFCDEYGMQCLDVNKIGFYQWSDHADAWVEITEESIKIFENLKIINENNLTENNLTENNLTENDVIWNLKITLLHGEEIKTNNKNCSLEELFEAIQSMQKPSLFGKKVKSFTIYKE
jgi:hypothetical protein